ncbi:MAG: hypothetical protein ACJ8EE_15855 [Bradyrhizobium sp.]
MSAVAERAKECVIRSWQVRTRKGDTDRIQTGCLSDALPFWVVRPYLRRMTKLLEKALEAVRRLPPDSQDEIALAMLTLSGHEGEPEEIDPAHLPVVLEGLAQAKRRQFATDAQIEAAFRRFEQ